MYPTLAALQNATKRPLSHESLAEIQDNLIDKLVTTAVFSPDEALKAHARIAIHDIADALKINSSSTHNLYQAFGKGILKGFTVPAMNVRTLTYDFARVVFQLAQEQHAGAFIFEIAKTEMEYTMQRPDEFSTVILAAAIKEGYFGPIFIQGDHFQFSAKKFEEDPKKEEERIKKLIDETVRAKFYNIDIDASTLVDLTAPNLQEQQETNALMTARLTQYIRKHQPKDITVSIGGEIGHIGGKNSTTSDLEAFMQLYLKNISVEGICKVSVQTGTSHGGTPLSDGTIAQVSLDFSVLSKIGKVAREKYGLGGPVQHGASTLPLSFFDKFAGAGTLEIHLATGFQNTIYDRIPKALQDDMYAWVKKNLSAEREDGWTEEQFIYKLRKKALGPYKNTLWGLSASEKAPVLKGLRKQLTQLFDKLHVKDTLSIVKAYA